MAHVEQAASMPAAPALGAVAPSGNSFTPIRATGRLAIPVAGRVAAEQIVPRPTGTRVAAGESLVEKAPENCPAVLAPVAGTIAGMGVAKLSARLSAPAILLDPDLDASPSPQLLAPSSADSTAIKAMIARVNDMGLSGGIERLRSLGVWADRWTTPDLLAQLRSCVRKPVDTVLCDALDETPYLLLHNRITAEFATEMAAGILALAAMTNATRVWAVLPAFGDPASWEAMRRAAAGLRLKLVPLQDFYPQSHPSLLIHELTGRHSRPERLPTESGVLAVGAATAVAVGRCFLRDEPMLTIPVGLHDRSRRRTHWLSVPLGMPWSQVLEHLSIPAAGLELRAGNPLREMKLSRDCVIAGEDVNVTAGPREGYINPDPCIRCAWCVEGCPVQIQPAGLLEASQQDDPYLADGFGLDACIECGICSYVCPSHLPILTGIRTLRTLHGGSAGKPRG